MSYSSNAPNVSSHARDSVGLVCLRSIGLTPYNLIISAVSVWFLHDCPSQLHATNSALYPRWMSSNVFPPARSFDLSTDPSRSWIHRMVSSHFADGFRRRWWKITGQAGISWFRWSPGSHKQWNLCRRNKQLSSAWEFQVSSIAFLAGFGQSLTVSDVDGPSQKFKVYSFNVLCS